MARKFIDALRPGDSLEQPFLVREKQLRAQRNGNFYIDLDLMDRTGSVSAKMWDATQVLFETFAEDDFVMVKARTEVYRKQLQLLVTAIQRIDPGDVDPADFLPSTKKDVGVLLARLREIVSRVENAHLKALLAAFLEDRDFVSSFQRAPAAVSVHHAWLGGLLEHTVSVTELALLLADRYPSVSRDLLVAGAILHDIGKIEEFAYERGFRYSDAGGLVGHLPLGVLMVERRAAQLPGFPETLRQQLAHLILSHHGQHEFGSPVLPATAEAVALHHIDNIDAKLVAFEQAMLDDVNPESRWTEWNRTFDRKLFKGRV